MDSPQASRRILVVDDHIDTAESFAILLRAQGHEVETALDGVNALRVAVALRPNLVLMDINMPKLDGMDACKVIRAQPWGESTWLVAITGVPAEDIRSSAIAAGFDDCLVKPVEPDELRRIVAAASIHPRV